MNYVGLYICKNLFGISLYIVFIYFSVTILSSPELSTEHLLNSNTLLNIPRVCNVIKMYKCVEMNT